MKYDKEIVNITAKTASHLPMKPQVQISGLLTTSLRKFGKNIGNRNVICEFNTNLKTLSHKYHNQSYLPFADLKSLINTSILLCYISGQVLSNSRIDTNRFMPGNSELHQWAETSKQTQTRAINNDVKITGVPYCDDFEKEGDIVMRNRMLENVRMDSTVDRGYELRGYDEGFNNSHKHDSKSEYSSVPIDLKECKQSQESDGLSHESDKVELLSHPSVIEILEYMDELQYMDELHRQKKHRNEIISILSTIQAIDELENLIKNIRDVLKALMAFKTKRIFESKLGGYLANNPFESRQEIVKTLSFLEYLSGYTNKTEHELIPTLFNIVDNAIIRIDNIITTISSFDSQKLRNDKKLRGDYPSSYLTTVSSMFSTTNNGLDSQNRKTQTQNPSQHFLGPTQ